MNFSLRQTLFLAKVESASAVTNCLGVHFMVTADMDISGSEAV